MKKIIFIHLLNDYSGSPKVLSQVIRYCQDKGFKIELFTGTNSKGFLSSLTSNHQFYFYKRFDNKYSTLVSFAFSQVILFFKLLKYLNKDVVIYVNTMLPFGAALAGMIMKKPVYYHVHENYLSPPSLKYFLRYIIQKTATKVIFVSAFLKKQESFEDKEQHVIPNALTHEFHNASRGNKCKSQKNNSFNVLMISSLKTYKGINEFVAIANQLNSNSHISFTLVLNADKAEIDHYFSKITLPINIDLVARQKNVIKFYQKSNLVLNLSKIDECIETFGLTILEAMAFGIPVIVPPVGGPAEIVTDGVHGFLISSSKINEISKKIYELSTNEQKWMELSKNALKRSKDFSEASFNSKIEKILDA